MRWKLFAAWATGSGAMATDRPPKAGSAPRVRSVRVRITLAAVIVVMVATTVGAVFVTDVFGRSLTAEVADNSQLRAEHIAAAVTAEQSERTLQPGDEDDDIAQLIADDGRVIAASPNAKDLQALIWPEPSEPVEVTSPFDKKPMIAVAHRINGSNSYVLVGRSLEERDEAVRLFWLFVLIGLPSLWFAIGLLTWILVGRALRPVDSIRRAVDEISSLALHVRVPVPPGDDEIARLTRTMNRMLERLEGAHAQQRRFVSDASHELRSPVAAIRQFAEVASLHPERTDLAEFSRAVLSESIRVQNLVEDLLLLARLDEDRTLLVKTALDLDDLVFEEAKRLREATSVRIDSASVGAGRATGDARALERVLRNLGENAVRHAKALVSFALSTQGGWVELIVDDDGKGIPDAERQRVLERFVRLDDARNRDAGGSGLGLAIVHEVVAAHGGSIRVEDSPLGGARIRLRLPAADETAQPAANDRPAHRHWLPRRRATNSSRS
jgi:signal transduction histidine kinase